jgi:hypothetical protein
MVAKISNKLDDMTAIPAIVTTIHKSHLNQRENIQVRLQVVSVEQPWGLCLRLGGPLKKLVTMMKDKKRQQN